MPDADGMTLNGLPPHFKGQAKVVLHHGPFLVRRRFPIEHHKDAVALLQ